MTDENKKPVLIRGGKAFDDRGSLVYNNNFNFKISGIKRFYMIENHQDQFTRAFHGHKYEAKYITVVEGCAKIYAIEIDNFKEPNKRCKRYRQILSAESPCIYYIPCGFANGIQTLVPGTKILVFSTSSIEDSVDDDYRYPKDYFNIDGVDIWKVEER